PESPCRLREALQKEGIEAWILCDLAEVIDPSWSDAVEGWLNTLRFACIVSPDDFPRALRAYDGLPRSVAGVPLPDIGRLAREVETDPAREGSLARLVETENPWARSYLDATLGDVMTADLSTLRRYSRAVTRECMSWSRHTATRIKEDVYRIAWLGASARAKRQESLVAEIENLAAADARAALAVSRAEEAIAACKSLSRSLTEAKYLERHVAERTRLSGEIEDARARLKEIDTSAFRGLEDRLLSIADMIKKANGELELILTESGSVTASRESTARRIELFAGELSAREAAFERFRSAHPEAEADCERYVAERLKSQKPEEILANFDKSRQGWLTRLDTAEKAYRARIAKHNNAFSEMLSAESEDISAIGILKKRLEDSELPEYLEKIRRARNDAEREFKDHFIARLNELIEGAKDSFSEINATLRSLTFGRDQYRFTLTERAERRGQIEIIRKTAEITDFENGLFDALVEESDRDAANELFSRILNSNLESAELRSLCDYRTYFTYDIRVRDAQSVDPATGKSPEYSLSRVLKEKSGGEAQTPYYVAIAASFFRFFRDKPDSTVRLVVFDEAFDRLDDDRIAKILAFYRELGLQVIVAVPSEKLESIAPHMDAINLVIRHGQLAKTVEFRDRSREREVAP
ncbi:MAG TPA: SbcC/MukB-like Walker B domain-containing protein, partial [Treponemataceae bacterium]|nr:SbcC/MukB-like Walker B domain-containing protein [Treponemataceae bacterium]